MLLRGQNLVGYKHYPDDVVTKFVEKSYENGVDVFRIFDALNDVRNMEKAIKVAKGQGAHVQGTISYTISPVHSIDNFVELAKDLEALDCDSVAIKDMAGLITPTNAYELVTKSKEETGLLVDLHCHCTSGMTPISYYAACQAGVDILDTAISPLAWGTSQPPTESMVAALQGTEFDTGLDLTKLDEISRYFTPLREKYIAEGLLDPKVLAVNANALIYQVPGGMLSNLISQLKKMGNLDQILGMMPGVNAGALKNAQVDEKQMARIEAIILSMTPEERLKPDIINGSRRKRIAKGCGLGVEDVNRLLKQFEQMKKMMKQLSGKNAKKLLGRRMGF
jgi:pyruvate carboxylase subunit B